MTYNEDRTGSGVLVSTVGMPQARSVSAVISVSVGSRHEPPEHGGHTHFLEHLLSRGTLRYPGPDDVDLAVARTGGSRNACTGSEYAQFLFSSLPGDLLGLLDVLADQVLQPLLAPDAIDRERGPIAQEIRRYLDDEQRQVFALLERALFPGHGLSRPTLGSTESLAAVRADGLRKFMGRYFGAGNLVLTVGGRVDHGVVLDWAENAFAAASPSERPLTVAPGPPADEVSFGMAMPCKQLHLVVGALGLPLGHLDLPVLSVLNAVLGGGMTSRLMLRVRRRESLAYQVGSFVQTYTDTGTIGAYTAVSEETAGAAVTAILEEIAGMRRAEITSEELMIAQRKISFGLAMVSDDAFGLTMATGQQLATAGRRRDNDEFAALVQAVTAEQVMELAEKLLAPETLRLAVVGPEGSLAAVQGQFEDQLAV